MSCCPEVWGCDGDGRVASYPVGAKPAWVAYGPWRSEAEAEQNCPQQFLSASPCAGAVTEARWPRRAYLSITDKTGLATNFKNSYRLELEQIAPPLNNTGYRYKPVDATDAFGSNITSLWRRLRPLNEETTHLFFFMPGSVAPGCTFGVALRWTVNSDWVTEGYFTVIENGSLVWTVTGALQDGQADGYALWPADFVPPTNYHYLGELGMVANPGEPVLGSFKLHLSW